MLTAKTNLKIGYSPSGKYYSREVMRELMDQIRNQIHKDLCCVEIDNFDAGHVDLAQIAGFVHDVHLNSEDGLDVKITPIIESENGRILESSFEDGDQITIKMAATVDEDQMVWLDGLKFIGFCYSTEKEQE